MSSFEEEARQIRTRCHDEPLKILVWGPGNPGRNAAKERKSAYQKRLQIRDVLRKQFTRAEVFFSEEEGLRRISWPFGKLRQEALQAKIADIIIMLDISRGVDLELDHFIPTYPWFREKVVVFLPQQYAQTKGLAKEVFDYLKPEQVKGFTDKEFSSCKVATVMSVEAAETFALAKLLSR